MNPVPRMMQSKNILIMNFLNIFPRLHIMTTQSVTLETGDGGE